MADCGYGDHDEFRHTLREAGLPFAMALKPNRGTWAYRDEAHTLVEAARTLTWTDPEHPGKWTPVVRAFRDGHTETWWAADARRVLADADRRAPRAEDRPGRPPGEGPYRDPRRLDLSAVAVQRRLAGLGAALIAFGYGVPFLLTRISGRLHDLAQQPWGAAEASASSAFDSASDIGKAALESGGDTEAADGVDGWMLLPAQPHSGSTFDMAGSLGVAITVLVGATVATARPPWLRRLLTPVIAVGTMSLTAYVGHFVASTTLSVPLGDSGPAPGALEPDAHRMRDPGRRTAGSLKASGIGSQVDRAGQRWRVSTPGRYGSCR